ncbi:MAG TPA: tetratricopeptide repeat protein [Kofleriaceae bacterium]|nr:tetratricopeptide repeat protein [Kofleriaceae bacterium]
MTTGDAQPSSQAPVSTDTDRRAARKLVDEGIAAQSASHYDKAIELYQKAFALVPHPILLFNIAQAYRLASRSDQAMPFYERYLTLEPNGAQSTAARTILAGLYFNHALAQRNFGQEVEARESLERALQHGEASLDSGQLQEAQKQLREIERQLGRIRVTCQTKGAEVTLDGKALFTGPGSYQVWVKAEEHKFVVKKAGYLPDTRKVVAASGEIQTIELRLVALSERTDGTDTTETNRRWAKWKPWAVAAAGGALAMASGWLHMLAVRNFNDYDREFLLLDCTANPDPVFPGCPKDSIPSRLNVRLVLARREQKIALGGYIVGGSLIATGIILSYLNRPHMEQGFQDSSFRKVAVIPVLSTDSISVALSGNY